jgi:glutamate transport system permease protein
MKTPRHTVLFDSPGPKALRRILILNIVGIAILVALLAGVAQRFADHGQFEAAKWRPLIQWASWRDFFIPGLLSTLEAAAVSVVGAIVFGLVFGLGRLSSNAPIRWFSSAVVEFFRAVPVLLMMMFCWIGLGYTGFISPNYLAFVAVVIGLVLYNGSVVAELVRSGVHSLPAGQHEAAAAIGLRRSQSLISVEVPQALLAMLPALVAQLVVVLKDSALGNLVSYSELLHESQRLGAGGGNSLQTLLVAVILFLVINYSLGRLAEHLGTRLRGRAAKFTDQTVDELPPSVSTVLELAVVDEAATPVDQDPAYYTRDHR